MKKLTIMIIATLIGSTAVGQKYFEGKVTYKMSMKGFGAGNNTEEWYYRADGSYAYKSMMMKSIYLADKDETYNIIEAKGKIISFDTMSNATRSADTIYYGIDTVEGQLCTRIDTRDSAEGMVYDYTTIIYHNLDTIDGRLCIKMSNKVKVDSFMTGVDTEWIDTTVNVLNNQSPSGKGLNIKTTAVMSKGKIKIETTQQLASIEETEVPDSLFVLPQLGNPTADSSTVATDKVKSKYMVETSEGTFRSDIESGIVLVDFWATWCAPCQVLTPKMEAIAQKHADEVKVLKLDVDKCKSLAKEYKAEFIPMVVVMKNGKEIGRLVGADFQNTEEVIWQKIKAIIK